MKLSQTPWGELGDPNAWVSWDHVQPSKALTLFLCSVLRSAAPLGSEFLEGRGCILLNSVFPVPGVSRWPSKCFYNKGGMDSVLGKQSREKYQVM